MRLDVVNNVPHFPPSNRTELMQSLCDEGLTEELDRTAAEHWALLKDAVTAGGVASPSAHGHAMTSTATPKVKASDKMRMKPPRRRRRTRRSTIMMMTMMMMK